MRLLKLDDAPETNATAPVILKKFSPKASNPIVFTQNSQQCLARVWTPKELSEIVLLAHSNSESLGDYSGKGFADKFTHEFEKRFGKKEDKLVVRHIYILSCEVSLKNHHGHSLAQIIANQLYAKGFQHVVVHAIKAPNEMIEQYADMRVSIAHNESRALKGEYQGNVKAYLFTASEEKALTALDEKIKRNMQLFRTRGIGTKKSKELKQQLEQDTPLRRDLLDNTCVFFCSNDVKRKMELRQHTFVPQQRLIPYVPPDHQRVIEILAKKALELENLATKSKKRDYKLELLSDLMDSLRKTDDIISVLNEALKKIEEQDRFIHLFCTTYRLIKKIRDAEVKTWDCDRLITILQKTKLEQKRKEQAVSDISAGKAEEKVELSPQLRDSLAALHRFADEQMRNYLSCCWLARTTWEHAKLYKATELKERTIEIERNAILNAKNYVKYDWHGEIKKLLDDEKLVQGIFSHNTKNLLKNILNYNPDRYIQDPDFDEEGHLIGLNKKMK